MKKTIYSLLIAAFAMAAAGCSKFDEGTQAQNDPLALESVQAGIGAAGSAAVSRAITASDPTLTDAPNRYAEEHLLTITVGTNTDNKADYKYNSTTLKWEPNTTGSPVRFPGFGNHDVSLRLGTTATDPVAGQTSGTAAQLLAADVLTATVANQAPVKNLPSVALSHVNSLLDFTLSGGGFDPEEVVNVKVGNLVAYNVPGVDPGTKSGRYLLVIAPGTESVTVKVNYGGQEFSCDVAAGAAGVKYTANYRYTVPLELGATELILGRVYLEPWTESGSATTGTGGGLLEIPAYALTPLDVTFSDGTTIPDAITLNGNGMGYMIFPDVDPSLTIRSIRNRWEGHDPIAIGREQGETIKLSIAPDGTVEWRQDAGSKYLVNTVQELIKLRGETSSSNGKTYLQEANIDMEGETNWTPINNFYGTLDGAEMELRNLTINSESNYLGFFSYNYGVITNVNIVKASLINPNTSTDALYLGGICGRNEGTISNSSFSGTVQSPATAGICGENIGDILDCVNYGHIVSHRPIGGICKDNSGLIKGCANYGTMGGTSTNIAGICHINQAGAIITVCNNYSSMSSVNNISIGGIASVNYGQVTYCINTAPLTSNNVAGIVNQAGTNSSILNCTNTATATITGFMAGGIFRSLFGGSGQVISNCVNNGDIIVSGNGAYAGGIMAVVSNSAKEATISECVNYGSVSFIGSGSCIIGGVVGQIGNFKVVSCINKGNISASNVTGGTAGGVGGITGSSSGNIEACVNEGTVTNTATGVNVPTGGIAGRAIAGIIKGSYNIGAINANTAYAGIAYIPANSYPTFENCYYGGSSIADAKGTAFGADPAWPKSTDAGWALTADEGEDGNYWGNLGGWNGGVNPAYPKLWWIE